MSHEKVIQAICEGKNILVIGGAGTGKSTVQGSAKSILGDTASLAPTGISALNVEGMTGHRALSLPISIPTEKDFTDYMKARNATTKKLFGPKKAVARVFYDEIGMVRSDQFAMADHALKSIYKNKKPFGGMQMCLFGDLSQIPPVVKPNEAAILQQHFGGKYFFQDKAFEQGNFEIIYLNDVKRQNNLEMIKHLNNIRLYGYNFNIQESLDFFNDTCLTRDIDEAIYLVTTNALCDQINTKYYNKLTTPEQVFFSKRTGVFKDSPMPDVMALKTGCKVMITSNDSEDRYVNGTLGIVEDFGDKSVYVTLMSGLTVEIKGQTYENFEYFTDPEGKLAKKTLGTFTQIPLKLSWAQTVHKSQGITLDKAYIDLGNYVFSAGIPYVGLSRLRTLEGLSLVRAMTKRDIIKDQAVLDFYIKTGGLELTL